MGARVVHFYHKYLLRPGLIHCARASITDKVSDSWCPRHDSNVKLLLRTELFYPLNYGGMWEVQTYPVRTPLYLQLY